MPFSFPLLPMLWLFLLALLPLYHLGTGCTCLFSLHCCLWLKGFLFSTLAALCFAARTWSRSWARLPRRAASLTAPARAVGGASCRSLKSVRSTTSAFAHVALLMWRGDAKGGRASLFAAGLDLLVTI